MGGCRTVGLQYDREVELHMTTNIRKDFIVDLFENFIIPGSDMITEWM